MTAIQNYLVTLSLALWLGIIVFELIKQRKKFWLASGIQCALILLIAYGLHRWFGYLNSTEIKGFINISEKWTLFGLYVFTILGITAQHIFVQVKGLNVRGRQPKLKWMPLLKPLVVSPIIFLAVLNQLTKMGAMANTLTAVLTQFILAFQNGFFWKTVIEQFDHKNNKTGGKDITP